jgi:hypothetical protein
MTDLAAKERKKAEKHPNFCLNIALLKSSFFNRKTGNHEDMKKAGD